MPLAFASSRGPDHDALTIRPRTARLTTANSATQQFWLCKLLDGRFDKLKWKKKKESSLSYRISQGSFVETAKGRGDP